MSNLLYLQDALTRHQIFLERYGGGWWKETKPIFDSLSKEIRRKILNTNIGRNKNAWVERVTNEIGVVLADKVAMLSDFLEPEVKELAEYEAGFIQRLMTPLVKDTVKLVGIQEQYIETFYQNRKLRLASGDKVINKTVPKLIESFERSTAKEIKSRIQAGVTLGDTNDQIAADVFRMTDKRTKTNAESLVRTVANGTASQTRQRFFKRNESVIAGYKFSATLDRKTSPICAQNDGKILPLDTILIPPLHFRCRSVLTAKLKDEFAVFERGATRRGPAGPVDGKTTYPSFLKRQSKAFQDEFFESKTRADLYRKGKLPLNKFIDSKGSFYSIKDLIAKENITI